MSKEVSIFLINQIIEDGRTSVAGMTPADRLGFNKQRNLKSWLNLDYVKAWFKKMYENGWEFKGVLEYEELPFNGVIIMDRKIKLIPIKKTEKGKLLEAKPEELEKEVLKVAEEIVLKKQIEIHQEAESLHLYKEFEEKNPGKHAVYQGKETKQFQEWKENKENGSN